MPFNSYTREFPNKHLLSGEMVPNETVIIVFHRN